MPRLTALALAPVPTHPSRGSGAGQQGVLGVGLRRGLGLALASAAHKHSSRGFSSGQSALVTGLRRFLGLALASAARRNPSRGCGSGQQSVLVIDGRRFLGLALASAALLGLAAPLYAAPKGKEDPKAKEREEKARALFDEAEKLYNVGEWERALAGYKEAYLLSDQPALLYNMAQCQRKLERFEEALTTYRAYLREVPDSPIRGEVEGRISELEAAAKEKAVAKLTITTTPPGAEVRLGGKTSQVIGKTPFRDEKLAPGQYHYTLTLEGYTPWEMDVTAEGGREYVIPDVSLVKAGAGPADVGPAPVAALPLKRNYFQAMASPALNLARAGANVTGGLELSYLRTLKSERAFIGGRFGGGTNGAVGQAAFAVAELGAVIGGLFPLSKERRQLFDLSFDFGISAVNAGGGNQAGAYSELRPAFLFRAGERGLLALRPLSIGFVRAGDNSVLRIGLVNFGYYLGF